MTKKLKIQKGVKFEEVATPPSGLEPSYAEEKPRRLEKHK